MNEELIQMKQYLPKGYCSKLAKDFKVTPMTVSNALSGKYRRFDIIQGAISMAKKNKAIVEKLRELNS
jgi:hypothetical protein